MRRTNRSGWRVGRARQRGEISRFGSSSSGRVLLAAMLPVLGAFAAPVHAARDVTISPAATSGITQSSGVWTPTANNATILSTDLAASLNLANNVVTTGSAGVQAGNITTLTPLAWSSGTALTLSASNGIFINSAVSMISASAQLILNPGASSTQSAVISGSGGLTKQGAGTLTLSQTNTYTGATTVSAGKLAVQNNLSGSSSVVVTGGTLELSSGGGSNRVIKTQSVSVTGTGKLDLKDNKLIATAGAGGTASGGVYNGLQGLVQQARGTGAWNGAGLTTSMPSALTGLTSIGVATGEQVRGLAPGATGTFAGQTINGAAVLAMYTYAGDANLDGLISGDDYAAIDFNIAVPGADGWHKGDFNYDGIISGDDYTAIDFNIAAQGAPFPTSSSPVGALTPVPEPNIAAIGVSVAAGATIRRRRRTL